MIKSWLLVLALAAGGAMAADGRWEPVGGREACLVWHPNPDEGEMVRWSGPCVDGKAEGQGVLAFQRGEISMACHVTLRGGKWQNGYAECDITKGPGQFRLAGQWEDGQLEGPGILSAQDFRCEGTFKASAQIDGTCIREERFLGQVDRYISSIRDGVLTGQITIEYHNGAQYQGGWLKGEEHGQGVARNSSGQIVYEGDYLHGQPFGEGRMDLADGSRYVGSFRTGHAHGPGTFTDGKGKEHKGQFKHGCLSEGGHHIAVTNTVAFCEVIQRLELAEEDERTGRLRRYRAPLDGPLAEPEESRPFRDRQADGSECPFCPLLTPGRGDFRYTAISTYEVTVREFRAFAAEEAIPAKEGACFIPVFSEREIAKAAAEAKDADFCGVFAGDDDAEERRLAATWEKPFFPQGEDHPVVCVDWATAQEYADWLSRKTGRLYRLPGVGEWQYFSEEQAEAEGNFGPERNSCPKRFVADDDPDPWPYTAPVGRFRPNPRGVHDMAGNVSEWLDSCDDGPHEFLGHNCRNAALADGSFAHPAKTARIGRAVRELSSLFLGFRVVRKAY